MEEWRKHPKENRTSALYEYIRNRHGLLGISDDSMKELRHHISRTSSKFAEKWKSSGGNYERFLTNHSAYLAEDFKCKVTVHHPKPSTSTPGRPTKTFDDLSDKSKKGDSTIYSKNGIQTS